MRNWSCGVIIGIFRHAIVGWILPLSRLKQDTCRFRTSGDRVVRLSLMADQPVRTLHHPSRDIGMVIEADDDRDAIADAFADGG